jgi:hypothetical protein
MGGTVFDSTTVPRQPTGKSKATSPLSNGTRYMLIPQTIRANNHRLDDKHTTP